MLKKMQQLEEFCDVTLVSDNYDRIRAHKVVLASASTLFRDLFQTDEENTEYEVIRMRGVSSNFMVSMVDLVYNGETTVKESDCEDFLKFLKEYKILKFKYEGETSTIRCNFYNRGFCRAGPDCMFDHPEEDCKSHMMGNVCRDRKCCKRHRMICKYSNSESGCTQGSECMFLHKDMKENENIVEKDSKQKCDACKLKKKNTK